MAGFASMMSAAYNIMSTEFSLYGFTFSYWDVFIWSIIITIVGGLIVRFFAK